MKKEIKRKLVMRTISFLLPTLALGSLYTYKDVNKKQERVAMVDENIRRELYYDNIIDYWDGYYFNNKSEDKRVTYEALSNLTELDINPSNNDDMNMINKCPNLKQIRILNSEFLTDEEIEIINNSNAKEVILEFGKRNIRTMREERFDVSRIKKDVKIGVFNMITTDDIDNIVFLNYIENYDQDILPEVKNLNYYLQLDEKLDEIIKTMNIDESMNDKEKIMLISNFICNNLEYDKDVIKALDEFKNGSSNTFKDGGRTDLYNKQELGSILNQTEEIKKGVCINYAALFDIICYKLNIKTRIVVGHSREYDVSHAWNIVYIGDKTYFVDLTASDNSLNERFLDIYSLSGDDSCNKDFYYEYLEDKIFLDINNGYKEYDMANINLLDQKQERKKSVNYYNENLDGKKVLNKPLDVKNILLKGISAGTLGLLIEELYRKTKEKKKIRRLTSK